MTVRKSKLDVQIRWLIRRDMPEVLQIEQKTFGVPWGDEEFHAQLRSRYCIGMAAEHRHRVVGFMVYELHPSKIHVLNFGVAPDVRRHQIGSQMIVRLIDKLSQQRRRAIHFEIEERNLDAQLFLRAKGFRAELYDRESGLISFLYRMQIPELPETLFQNRITELEES